MGHTDKHAVDKHVDVKRFIFLDPSILEVGTSATHESYGQGVVLNYPNVAVTCDAKGNFQIPSDFAGGNLKFIVYWNSPATTGDVYWKIYLNWFKAGEHFQNDTEDSGINMIDTAYITQYHVKAVSWTADGPFEAGDVVQIALDRLAGNDADTLDDVARCFGIKVEYTAEQ